MKTIYKYYEPDQGFEEIQAKIYSENLKELPNTAFAIPSADSIKNRFRFENKDPKGVCYAFSADNIPLAYIQTTIQQKPPQSWIGYPWSMNDCPSEVQEYLYSNMLRYITEKYPDNEIVMGYFSETMISQINFAKDHGFVEKDRVEFYELFPEKISNLDEQRYSSRIATIEDLGIVMELGKIDKKLFENFKDIPAMRKYFEEKVFPDGNVVLLFDNDLLIAASAPLRGFYKGIMIRFTGLRPGYENAWELLVYKLGQQILALGWKEPLFFTGFEDWDFVGSKAKELGATLLDTQYLFTLP